MKNWMTTILGLIAAVAIVLEPLFKTGTVTVTQVVQAAALAGLGYLAKQFNVTGTGA